MHAKTMEGLAGASMNMKMMNTPFRVYQEAERRGDTSVMERAMGYPEAKRRTRGTGKENSGKQEWEHRYSQHQ